MNRNRSPLATTLAAILPLLASGCAPVTSYTDAEAPKRLKLDSATTQVAVNFAPGTAAMSSADAAHLRRLAAAGAIDPNDRVMVAAAGGSELAKQRAGSVEALLLHYGIVPYTIQLPDVPPNRAIVEVGRTLVTLPACPNWSKPSGTEFDNQPSSNFGCATETNLGMMIASPSDLATGRPLGPAAGRPAAAAVSRYLNDKVSPLPQSGTAAAFTAGPSASPPAAAPSPGG